MTKDDIRYKIETLEYEIGRCDEKIRKLNEQIEYYRKEANDAREIAARGGDLIEGPDFFLKGAKELDEKIDRIQKYDIREKEKEREKYCRELEDYRRMLSETPDDDPVQPYSEPINRNNESRSSEQPIYSTPRKDTGTKNDRGFVRFRFRWVNVITLIGFALAANAVYQLLSAVRGLTGFNFLLSLLTFIIPAAYPAAIEYMRRQELKKFVKSKNGSISYRDLTVPNKIVRYAYNYFVAAIVYGTVGEGDSIDILFYALIVGIAAEWIRSIAYSIWFYFKAD